MSAINALYHLIRADFLERVRRYSFLLMLVFVFLLASVFIPSDSANYTALNLDGHRGIYNSAWVSSVIALLSTIYLTIISFYLVKNAIARDQETGVGQIIATTPLNKALYILGKWLSNFAVLTAVVMMMMVAAGIMQLIRGEVYWINLWDLAAPFLLIVLPIMAVTAAAAVFFESVPVLQGGFGNVAYFFLCAITINNASNALGNRLLLGNMQQAAINAFPNYDGNFSRGITPKAEQAAGGLVTDNFQTFVWDGVPWDSAILTERLTFFAIALGICLLAVIFFDRFDPTRNILRFVAVPLDRFGTGVRQGIVSRLPFRQASSVDETSKTGMRDHIRLTPLGEANRRFDFGQLLWAELRLLFKSMPIWWYVVAGGLILAPLFNPLSVTQEWLFPAAWLFPVLIWSSLGTREELYGTDEVVFSAPQPIQRQLPTAWLAGVIVALVTGSGAALAMILGQDISGLLALFVGALFIPALALALGSWSGSSKLFEVIYTTLWYVGPLNKVPLFDYMGVTGESAPLFYLVATFVLLAVAVAGRRLHIQN